MAWFGIWVSSIMDMAVCNSALCDVWMKTSENRLLMMQKLVVLSSFSIFSIMNVELLWNYWGISNCIDIKCIEWIDLWSVGLQIWMCVYVILQYVIFEWKLCFDHELKIEKMPVSGLFCVFKLRIHGSFGIHNWLATLYTHHAGPSPLLVGYISLDENYYVSPVNICWLRQLTGAHLDINLVFRYNISTQSFNMYVYCHKLVYSEVNYQ